MKEAENNPSYLLIVANSARMLAQAARKAGYLPLVIDLYNDQDTRRHAEGSICVPSFELDDLSPAIERSASQYSVSKAIYGAGFECHHDSLGLIADRFALWGNDSEVFIKSTDKHSFFGCLSNQNIPFPEVSFEQPLDIGHWLFKPWRGQGGVGIVSAKYANQDGMAGYWQKYQPGLPHSVLFLADGKAASVVGFNRQWTTQLGKDEFVFAGIINATGLNVQQKRQVSAWVDKLTKIYALKGLNSLDFIQDESGLYALEINPRPPASMQLYDADLVKLHIAACQGKLPDRAIVESGVVGYQIVYAPQTFQFPHDFYWPEEAADIPQAGAIINTHQPICSIIARDNAEEAVLARLNQIQSFIFNQLENRQSHGI